MKDWFKTVDEQIPTWKTVNGSYANCADADHTPHDVASDQGTHYMLAGCSIKTRFKATK